VPAPLQPASTKGRANPKTSVRAKEKQEHTRKTALSLTPKGRQKYVEKRRKYVEKRQKRRHRQNAEKRRYRQRRKMPKNDAIANAN